MIEKHPGGLSNTRRLIKLSNLTPDFSPGPKKYSQTVSTSPKTICRILDLGAGDGHSVHLLQELGFDAIGIDLVPGDSSLIQGDLLHCPFPNQSFDALLSECVFYISGNPQKALQEAARLLKPAGLLLLADVSFEDFETYQKTLSLAGFSVLYFEDLTPLWKEYYISCIWNDTVQELCPGIPKGKCRYYLTICERM